MNTKGWNALIHTVHFDLETRRLADEVGSWAALKAGQGGVSALVIWDDTTGRPHLYDDNTLDEAAAHLERADVVTSYNGKQFDVPLVEGHLGRKVLVKHHIDLLDLIWKALDDTAQRHKGNSLDEVATRTLARGKTGESTHAPALARQGRWAELFDYCLNDVLLLRDLVDHASREGGVVGPNGDLLLLDLPDWFTAREN